MLNYFNEAVYDYCEDAYAYAYQYALDNGYIDDAIATIDEAIAELDAADAEVDSAIAEIEASMPEDTPDDLPTELPDEIPDEWLEYIPEDMEHYENFTLSYKLTSGRTVKRYYRIWLGDEHGEYLKSVFSTPEAIFGYGEDLSRFLSENTRLSVRDTWEGNETVIRGQANLTGLYEAVLADCRSGSWRQGMGQCKRHVEHAPLCRF